MFSRKLTKPIAAVATAVAIAGATYGIVSATAGGGTPTATTTVGFGRRASNARSGPAAGGSTGKVESVSTSSFTLVTADGQTVTVDTASSTSSVTIGSNVLVLGTVDGTTITAGQVIVKPAGSSNSSPVVPFKSGTRSASKQVGQIPASYTQGSGTIVGGTAANKATEAALTAYLGGIVDRVVKLSNGEYEVHNIGVNWPHHIFVNQSFKVVGAN